MIMPLRARDNEKATHSRTRKSHHSGLGGAGRVGAGDGRLFPGRSGLRLPVSGRGVRMVIGDDQ